MHIIKRLTTLILLVCSVTVSVSQNEREIQDVLDSALKYRRYPDSLQKYSNYFLNKSKTDTSAVLLLRGFYYRGQVASLKGDLAESIVYYDSALVHQKRGFEQDFGIVATLRRNKAISYARQGENDSAVSQFKELIQLTKLKGNGAQLASAYNDLGVSYKNQGKYTAAIDVYQKAMKIWDSLDNEQNKTSILLNIGIAQGSTQNIEQSNASFREVIKIASKYNNERDLYRAYNNLSVNLNKQKKYDSALVYLYKLLPNYIKKKNKRAEYLAYQNIGTALLAQSKIDSAVYYIKKSLNGCKDIDYPQGQYESYFMLGKLHLKTKKYDTALQYADSSALIMKERKFDSKRIDLYTLYAGIHEGEGDFEKENDYLKKIQKVKQEQYDTENNKNLNELLTKHQVDQKNDTIENLNKETVIYKSTSFIFTCIALILGIMIYLFSRKQKTASKELSVLREKMDFYHKKMAANPSSVITLKSKAVLKTNELKFIKSDGHYLEFYLKNGNKPEIDRNTLKQIISELEGKGFAQIHKSYLVNLEYIRIINSTKIMLQDGTWLPLSRTYKPILKEILNANQKTT